MLPIPIEQDQIFYEDSYASVVDKEIQTDPTESFLSTLIPKTQGSSQSKDFLQRIHFSLPPEVVDEDITITEVFKREIFLAPENISNEEVTADYCRDVAIPYLNVLPPECELEAGKNLRDFLIIKSQDDKPDYPLIKDKEKDEERPDDKANMSDYKNKCDTSTPTKKWSDNVLDNVVEGVQKIVSSAMCPVCPVKPETSIEPAKPCSSPSPSASKPSGTPPPTDSKPPPPSSGPPSSGGHPPPPADAQSVCSCNHLTEKSPPPCDPKPVPPPPSPLSCPPAPPSVPPVSALAPPPSLPSPPKGDCVSPQVAKSIDHICEDIKICLEKVLQAHINTKLSHPPASLPYCDELPPGVKGIPIEDDGDLPFCDELEQEPPCPPEESPCPPKYPCSPNDPCAPEDPCPPKDLCPPKKIKDPVIAYKPPVCPGNRPKYYLADKSEMCPPCPKPMDKCENVSFGRENDMIPRHAIALNMEITSHQDISPEIQNQTGIDMEIEDQDPSMAESLSETITFVKETMTDIADTVYNKTQDAMILVDKTIEGIKKLSDSALDSREPSVGTVTETEETSQTETAQIQEPMLQTVQSPSRMPQFVTKVADAVDSTLSTLKERLDLDKVGYVIKENARRKSEQSSPYDNPAPVPPREVSHDTQEPTSITHSMFTSIKSTFLSFFGESVRNEVASNSSGSFAGSKDSPDNSDSLNRLID